MAALSIPRLGVSAVVLHGSDSRTLQLGLGHIENTPVPGESGNVAIAGHRDSFFRPLRNVQIGDDILLEMPEQRVHYRVSSFRVVDSHEVSVIGPTKEATLTLVTCYPFWFVGAAPNRFVVRATRVEEPAAVASLAAAAAGARSSPSIDEPIDGRLVRSTSESNAFVVPAANDDDTRVQKAVERFRFTYNRSLVGHGPGGADQPMTFRLCDVAVSLDLRTWPNRWRMDDHVGRYAVKQGSIDSLQRGLAAALCPPTTPKTYHQPVTCDRRKIAVRHRLAQR